MHRFFAERLDESTACLLPEEEGHALRVLRLRPGDACQALLEGQVYTAVIQAITPRVTLALTNALPSPEPSVSITLYQGIPKGEKMDYIAQKCTEAGVCRIVPVSFTRCVTNWDGKDAAKKQARFQRIAAEAAKQSGRAITPEVSSPLSFGELCNQVSKHDLILVPWEEEHGNGIRANWRGEKDVAVIIGPEGGIAPEEIERLKTAGAKPVTLGPRIFRTETAGLAAVISLLTLSEDME